MNSDVYPKVNLTNSSNPKMSGLMNKLITRIISGAVMIAGFAVIVSTNIIVVSSFVILLEILVYREMISIRIEEAKERNLKRFRILSWFFFYATLYYTHGITFLEWLSQYVHIPSNLFERHNWYSFVLYIIGLCAFVFNLRKGTLKYQFGQMTWIIMTLLITVVQCNFILKNIREGMIWLILPHSLIVCNDIFAYFVGISIGKRYIKRPLTILSPNKSWEGFIGALIITVLFSFFISGYLGNIERIRCPSFQLETEGGCPSGDLYTPFRIHEILNDTLKYLCPSWTNVMVMKIQLHALVFGLFASIIAPFGGFFASAMKRAYNKKDFDNVIPGHGGFTDRLDCHFIIGLFTYVYYTTWIMPKSVNMEDLIAFALSLSINDQKRILEALGQ